jgi:hypothetical protein
MQFGVYKSGKNGPALVCFFVGGGGVARDPVFGGLG